VGLEILKQAHSLLDEHHIKLVFAELVGDVKAQFDKFGFSDTLGEHAFFESVPGAIAAFKDAHPSETEQG